MTKPGWARAPGARPAIGAVLGDQGGHWWRRHVDWILSRCYAQVVTWLEGLSGEVAITAVTLAELLAGLRRLPRGGRQAMLATKIKAALEPYRDARSVLPFDDEAADHYADIFVAREKAGLPISLADAQIAAICRANAATCATRNTKGFDHTGVQLINPWAP